MISQDLVSDTAPTSPAHGRPASAGDFELNHEIEVLKSGTQYATTGQAARTLFKRPELRVVLIVLRANSDLKEHRTNQPVSIQTLTGAIRVTLPERAIEQAVGGLIVIESGVVHDVIALEDSAFLLSMPWSDHAED